MSGTSFRNLGQIPIGVWAIGLVTFFINLSGVIIFNYSSLYMVTVLGVSTLSIGWIEGVVEAVSWFMRFFSGFLSDFFKKRKPSLLFAYSLIAISRLVFAFVPGLRMRLGVDTIVNTMVSARLAERVGNGIQASPREALVGDISPPQLKGASYGLRESLSKFGSFFGAGVAWLILSLTNNDFEILFSAAGIAPFIGVLLLIFFVHEKGGRRRDEDPKPHPEIDRKEREKFSFSNLPSPRHLPILYWKVLSIAIVFSLSLYSGAFLMIRATKDFGMPIQDTSLIMMVQNISTFLAAFPMGWMSDMFNRRYPLIFGMILLILGNSFLAFGDTPIHAMLGAGFWGAQVGITYSLINTKIADATPKSLRGTGFGLYYLLTGGMLLITNGISGYLAENHGNQWVFIASSVWSFLAIVLVLSLNTDRKAHVIPQ